MNKYNGFSLIEMAIALAVIGFLAGGLLGPMSLAIDYKKFNYTDATLEQIKEALIGFAVINGRLPCPAKCSKYDDGNCFNGFYDASYVGKEDKSDIVFCEQEGYLPWADLGIGRYDAWDKPFYYRVDKNYSTNISANTSLQTDSNNILKIKYKQTGNNLTVTEASGNSRLIVIVLSYGKNSVAESSNKITIANDATYMQGDYNSNENNYFDDRLTWISKYTLTNYLAKTRELPQ